MSWKRFADFYDSKKCFFNSFFHFKLNQKRLNEIGSTECLREYFYLETGLDDEYVPLYGSLSGLFYLQLLHTLLKLRETCLKKEISTEDVSLKDRIKTEDHWNEGHGA